MADRRRAARGGVWFAVGATHQLHIGVEDDFVPARKAHPALVAATATLEALAEQLAAAGCDVRWDGALHDIARFYIEDPWGNRLELMEEGG